MACGCSKKKAGAGGVPASARAGNRPVVKRTITQRPDNQAALRGAQRPLNRLRYYVVGPDGTEEDFASLAEAQTVLRRSGSGYRIESRRG